MKQSRIVIGQKVSQEKKERASELKRNMTPAEKTLWQELRGNRLNGRHFRRQQIIAGFIVDFYCHEVGLVVEVDGDVHDTQLEYDDERGKILDGMGFKIIRFSNDSVLNDIQEVLSQIAEHLPLPVSGRGPGG
jgi:very-short-patch-repair endonuclease